jgi:PAS domain S-box-containing protein
MNSPQSIEEIKHQFEQLATHLPMAVALLDMDMRYLFVSQRWIEDYRLAESDIISRSHYDVFPEIGEGWKAIHQHCLRGHVHRDEEVLFRRLDGSTEWISREIRPWTYRDGHIGGLIMYTEVITERKQTQDELRYQHQFLRQVMDLNTNFVFAKDKEGYFTLVNQALADAYGSTIDDMVGKSDIDFNPNSDEVKNIRADDLEVLRTRTPKFISEEPVTQANGVTRWYQTTKVPLVLGDSDEVQLLGIATDITERKRIQDELHKQHRFLRHIIDLNTNLIFVKDAEGKFLLVNKTLADGCGVEPDEMVGKSDEDYNPDVQQVANIRRDDLEVLTAGKTKFIPEEPITDAITGEIRWYQTIKVPFMSDDGESIQLVGVSTDITERKRSQEQLEKLVVQEQEARQIAETAAKMKDLFMANMSHELRTPLNAMIGFLREMLYSTQLDTDNTHMAERSLANSKRLEILINSVLDLSRLAVGTLELVITEVDLRDLATMSRDDLSIQAKAKGLSIELEIDDTLPKIVNHDEERLIQIISNLMVNAIKYTEQGHVKLALENDNDKNLIIRVTDTGIGIPAHLHAKIFEDFIQLEDTHRHAGAGLGLSIVKSLVELMDGTIALESEVGEYTTFIVTLSLQLAG